MKSYFGEAYSYTLDAVKVSKEIGVALQKIFEDAIANGFPPRELVYLINNEAHSICAEICLRKAIEVRNNKYKV